MSELERMRANRDLWVRRHSGLEEIIRLIRWQIERFEESVEQTDDWAFACGADDLVTLGWVRVLCDVAFEPRAAEQFGRQSPPPSERKPR